MSEPCGGDNKEAERTSKDGQRAVNGAAHSAASDAGRGTGKRMNRLGRLRPPGLSHELRIEATPIRQIPDGRRRRGPWRPPLKRILTYAFRCLV